MPEPEEATTNCALQDSDDDLPRLATTVRRKQIRYGKYKILTVKKHLRNLKMHIFEAPVCVPLSTKLANESIYGKIIIY